MLKLKILHADEYDLKICEILSNRFCPPYDDYIETHYVYSYKEVSDCVIDWMFENVKVLRKNATRSELAVCSFLSSRAVHYCFQKMFCIDSHVYFADIFVYDKKIVVEIDGRGHKFEDQRLHDEERDRLFSMIGIRTVRIPNYVALNSEQLEKALLSNEVI